MTANVPGVGQAQNVVKNSQSGASRSDASSGWASEVAPARPVLAPWQVRLAMNTMLADLPNSITISDLAASCRLSLSYFVRAFANSVGMSPYAWLLRKRVDRSKILLQQTGLPLAHIALECGFADQSHFTKIFARMEGTTPARWRRADLGESPNCLGRAGCEIAHLRQTP
ncbi:MAG TPA: AraC family transcriptional regulator [Sphingobium sp.]|uniref:helix-turn-helix domain-containing protein n=1 Tax=Sphingobium sp. TaxID=1912891 RepID=UPI002ED5DC97